MEKSRTGLQHFKDAFSAPESFPIEEILQVLNIFPWMISEEMNNVLKKEVEYMELKHIIWSFKKDKSPGPDELINEFFLGFFDLLKYDLLKVVKEPQKSQKVLDSLNSTFIALIPKSQNPSTFGDFHPFSCYNLIYKIFSKIIAQCLKPILSSIISEE